ncbi:hypothetical protein LCGC14_1758420 [marine sediment metagenome]|uniref:Uncharacterized protein n=1 Tax=marine sediment metagenome TaxID=412755 RepID=A0A0F9JGW6_9ZZZZ
MKKRKYPLRCCPVASATISPLGLHCSFCGTHLCPEHSHDVEVEGHIFLACGNCSETLASRRPGKHEHCQCHTQEFCEIHNEIEGIG